MYKENIKILKVKIYDMLFFLNNSLLVCNMFYGTIVGASIVCD